MSENRRPPDPEKEKQAVEAWNAAHPVGTAVTVELDDGSKKQTTTSGPATVLQNGVAVIWVEGISGCYKLDRVKPTNGNDLDPEYVRAKLAKMFPGQPVGISKIEVWTYWHHNGNRVNWDIHIGEPIIFRVSDLYPKDDEFEKPETLREAFEVLRTWDAARTK